MTRDLTLKVAKNYEAICMTRNKEAMHNEKRDWLEELRMKGAYHEKRKDVMIATETILKQTKLVLNWKFPGLIESRGIGSNNLRHHKSSFIPRTCNLWNVLNVV